MVVVPVVLNANTLRAVLSHLSLSCLLLGYKQIRNWCQKMTGFHR